MPTRVVNVKGLRPPDLPPDAAFVYIGRPNLRYDLPVGSIWANPYRVQKQLFRVVDSSCCATAAEAIERYTRWVHLLISNRPDLYNVATLRGKRLGCWCGRSAENPDLVCHAMVLARLAEALP